ncbi:zinc-ribbon domain-containing protein [Nocardia arthritidis]|uniref:Zinc-ribbon domain-containing protein n=1 Tax=Nocardia arthritidis TaxID=228602 RepID=A0A6G9YAX7_9NOCA|nr:zinc-ribbon domain-containing protein [Nocardia arthritidis]QIS10371.1 zinc-ribbon domain-containing protein [Nocardia arthritidis]
MLIWGWRRYVRTMAMITFVCGNCRNPSAHALRELVTKFTLFFIPLFPVSTKHELQCTFCGVQSKVPSQDVPNLMAQAHAQNMPQNGYSQPQPTGQNAPWPPQR